MSNNPAFASFGRFELHTEVRGETSGAAGDRLPIVFVHGSWTDADSWQLVAPALAAERVTVVYDRRGHSRSPWLQPVSRRQDEEDLIELIEHIGSGNVHLVGNSYGASIALAVTARRSDLVASVVAHEPPLLGAATSGTPIARDLDELRTTTTSGSPDGCSASPATRSPTTTAATVAVVRHRARNSNRPATSVPTLGSRTTPTCSPRSPHASGRSWRRCRTTTDARSSSPTSTVAPKPRPPGSRASRYRG